MVAELRELGFLEDQARNALSQSNNNLAVAADILMKPLDNTTTRVRFDESIRPDETRLRVPVMSSGVWWIHIHTTSQTWADVRKSDNSDKASCCITIGGHSS